MIVKPRNYSKLNDAIKGAEDEETSKKTSSQQVLNMRGRGGFVKHGSRAHNTNINFSYRVLV